MERRKFIAGLGSLTAGTAAVFGTGAANSFMAQDRAASISVVPDGNGVLGIKDRTDGDIVNVTDGTLEIDFAQYSDSQGVPLDSVIELGDTGGGKFDNSNAVPSNTYSNSLGENAAFGVANYAAGQNVNIGLKYTAGSNFNLNADGSQLLFGYRDTDNQNRGTLKIGDLAPYGPDNLGENASPGDSTSWNNLTTLTPGETVEFAVVVDTTRSGADTNEDISGSLSIIAEEQ